MVIPTLLANYRRRTRLQLNSSTILAANRLLAGLPVKDQQDLLADCEQIQLIFDEPLYAAGERISHVYFPISSFISLVTPLESGSGLEVGLIGDEGILGITLILGVEVSPFQALVQGQGLALRIPTDVFLKKLELIPALQQNLKRYLYVSICQLAKAAACCRIHVVEARLARWLLMTQDRAHSETLHITHVFLAYMLGVRRVGITKAASSLQRQKLISYRRGIITIIDRIGLEAVSCGCYQNDKKIYEMIMMTMPKLS